MVSFVSVTTDRVPDVSSLEAWQRSFITPGMSDADKAQAVWKSVVAFRHQDEPARELVSSESGHPHDPIKLFNVYGYSQCDCASAAVVALGRSAGLTGRGRSLTSHSVAELSFDGGWHMFDAAYIDQFPRADGSLAAVDDLVADVTGFLGQHPDMQSMDHAALVGFQLDGGYKAGPPLLANCPYYDGDGLFPAKVQGWADTMLDYRAPSLETEFGYTLGYRVNVQLRMGEKLVRNWSNAGKHINDDLGIACESVKDVVGQGDMCYSPAYGDLANGRVGNGQKQWTMPIDGGTWRDGVLAVDNLYDAGPAERGPRVRVDDDSRPGSFIVRLPSSYVYLDGTLTMTATIGSGGKIVVEGSRNHGLDWTPVATITRSGGASVNLTPLARRLYDYELRLTLVGGGTGFDALTVVHDIQHSQRALPALGMGDNHVHFSAGPPEGTITLEAATDGAAKGMTYRELHPMMATMADGPLHPTARAGAVTFPVATPGDLVRLRLGGFYRARAAGDAWDYQVSFDGGKTFRSIGHAAGPTVGAEEFVTFDKVPAGTRAALVRFSGTQADTLDLFDFRIDADYREPLGGFAPVRVTYAWTEDGVDKTDVHDVKSADESWTIHCDGVPRMKSITLERVGK